MAIRIAINGFGRIGRTFLRVLMEDEFARSNINIVAINEGPIRSTNPDLLFKYDSIMGTFKGTVEHKNHILNINNHPINLFNKSNPTELPWEKLDIDWVIEASGCFTKKEDASVHIKAGAKKVLISAPSPDADATIIPGVNLDAYDSEKHHVISLGSCTTNCFAPIVKIIKEHFSLVAGTMTTIHAYTNNQNVLDSSHKDPRRARAAATNIIPAKTGASNVIIQLFPELEGKLNAIALRVPVPIVSLIDFAFITKQTLTKESINNLFAEQANGDLKNIIHYATQPLVSSDYIGSPYSAIIDSPLTQATDHFGKIFAWYDNEYGYSMRLKDFLLHNQ